MKFSPIKLFRCFLFITIGLCLSLNAGAQKIWTLQDCIKYALDNNIQIKRQGIQTEISQKNYNQSKLTLLPNLTIGGGHNWNFGLAINPITGQPINNNVISDNLNAQSTLIVFDGFQQINTIEQNRYLLDKSLQDFEKAKNDITMQIATAYLQILLGEESLVVAKQQVEYSHQQTEKMYKLVDVGNKAKGDLLVMKASEANDQYNYITGKNNLDIAYLTLSQLLELKSTEGFSIAKLDSLSINIVSAPSAVDDVYKESITKLPQIKSAEMDLKNYEKGVDIAKGQLSPLISLSGSYSNFYENIDSLSFSKQLKYDAYKTISVSINIPIFNRFQTRTNISLAKLKVVDSQYNLEQTKKSLYKDIQTAYLNAVAALEKYNSANESVKSNEEAFNYSQQKYDVGLLSAVDYNLAKTNLIKAKSDLIDAKYQYIFNVKILDFYRGNPIVL